MITSAGNNVKALQVVMERQGLFKKFGLEAKVEHVVDDSKMIPALLSGQADIAACATCGGLFSAVERGAGLKLTAGSLVSPGFALFVNSQVKAMKDLEGKVVGISTLGSLLHTIALALFQKAGVDGNKVDFVNVGSSTDVFRAVVANKIAGGPSTIDFLPLLPQNPTVKTIADVWKELPDFVLTATYVSDQAIARKRDVLVRTLAAYASVYRYLNEPAAEAETGAAYKQIGGDEAAGRYQWQWWRDNKALGYDLTLSERQVSYMQDLNINVVHAQKQQLPFSQVADMSLAQDALKLLS